jgi:hypothetical protein
VERIEHIRWVCNHVYQNLMKHCPHSRERSLAITKLEEALMWANKAIVFEEQP